MCCVTKRTLALAERPVSTGWPTGWPVPNGSQYLPEQVEVSLAGMDRVDRKRMRVYCRGGNSECFCHILLPLLSLLPEIGWLRFALMIAALDLSSPIDTAGALPGIRGQI